MARPSYRGRFAPSPTGPLHFGSLAAAVASFADARASRGEWLVRIEDADAPRNVPGASEEILGALEDFGFEWDGPVVYQSQRGEIYRAAWERLRDEGAAFPCSCTRKEIADSRTGLSTVGERPYPGTCRAGLKAGRGARSWRLRVSGSVEFADRAQGRHRQELESEVGDFVVLRADGVWAYQLAVVVDDAAQGITDVVRGADLLASTPRQIFLQRCLGAAEPRYLHVPVAFGEDGAKLSKQTDAMPLDQAEPGPALLAAAAFLGQSPPPKLVLAPPKEFWAWMIEAWRPENVPKVLA